MRPISDCLVVQSWMRSMGMIFDARPKTPDSILMRWSVSVYAIDCHRIHTTLSQSRAIETAANVMIVRKCGMPVPDFTVRSTTPAMMSSTTGITRDFTSTIQCWWVLRMRFSPGRSSDIAAPTLSHLIQDDQRARRQVGAVSDRAFQRPPPDDDCDRHHPGDEHAVEQRLDRRQRAEQKAHERRELDVAEAERLGFEDESAGQCEQREQQPGRDARRQPIPPLVRWVRKDAVGQGEAHRGEDDAVEDEAVLEVEEHHLHEHQHEN